VGLLPDAEFGEGHETLAPGDVLIVFTDGIVEAEDAGGAELGDERVIAAARQSLGAPALEIFEKILVETFGHIRESGFRDDATLLVIKRSAQRRPSP
jgi:sigma-B regulation protein RsbU (phosphoserine phosphatase)